LIYNQKARRKPGTKEEVTVLQIFRDKFYLGRDYFFEYIRLTGKAARPDKEGWEKLSSALELNIEHLKKHVNFYLDN